MVPWVVFLFFWLSGSLLCFCFAGHIFGSLYLTFSPNSQIFPKSWCADKGLSIPQYQNPFSVGRSVVLVWRIYVSLLFCILLTVGSLWSLRLLLLRCVCPSFLRSFFLCLVLYAAISYTLGRCSRSYE